MNKKNLFLILILFISVFFRFWQINKTPPGLYPDEAMNGNNALESLASRDFKVFYPENNGREGLFINIQAISIAVFGNKPWALRMVSGIFGVLTVFGVYFFVKELFEGKNKDEKHRFKFFGQTFAKNEVLALLSSYFIAASFWHINFSRIGFRAIMAPVFLVWSLYFLFLFFRKFKISLLVLAGFVYGLGFHSYIAYRATPLLIFLIFFYFWIKQSEMRKKIFIYFIVFSVSAFVSALPLLIYFYKNPHDFLGRTSQVSIFSFDSPFKLFIENILKTIGMFWYQGDYNWRHNFSGEPELWLPLGVFFALGIVISVYRFFKGRYILSELLLMSWIVVGLLPVVISSEGIPHALRAIIVIPPVMAITAVGIESFMFFISSWLDTQREKFKEIEKKIIRIKKEAIFFLFVFFASIAVYSYNLYFMRFAPRPEVAQAFSENYVELGSYLNTLPNDTKKYVVLNANGTDVRGYPMPSQTVMFITKTFLPEWQKEKNLHYILTDNLDEISCFKSCVITFLENDNLLRKKIKEKISGLESKPEFNFIVLKK